MARQLSNQLISKGHETFLDEKDIKVVDSIDSEVQQDLKDSDHLLIVISPSSLKSYWVFIEIGEAIALNKKVIPILLNVEANEVPVPISLLLARDINDFDTYLSEISTEPDVARKISPRSKPIKTHGAFKVGEKVKIVEAEHLSDDDKAIFPRWTPRMDKYSGRIATIIKFNEYHRAILDINDDAKANPTVWHTKWLLKIN